MTRRQAEGRAAGLRTLAVELVQSAMHAPICEHAAVSAPVHAGQGPRKIASKSIPIESNTHDGNDEREQQRDEVRVAQAASDARDDLLSGRS
jgi:hypothetical protein